MPLCYAEHDQPQIIRKIGGSPAKKYTGAIKADVKVS